MMTSPDWRPMETAPKADGPILLRNRYGDRGSAFWWRNKWHWWADGAAIEYMSDFGTEYKEFEVPDGWMPLPPA